LFLLYLQLNDVQGGPKTGPQTHDHNSYLRCGGVVNIMALKWPIMCWCAVKKLLTHGLLITELRKVYYWVCEWKFFLNQWIFGKVTSKSMVVSCTLHAWPTHCWKSKKMHDTIHLLPVTMLNIHRFKKISLSDLAINFS